MADNRSREVVATTATQRRGAEVAGRASIAARSFEARWLVPTSNSERRRGGSMRLRCRAAEPRRSVSCSLLARIDSGVIVIDMLSVGAFAWWAFPIGDLDRTSSSASAMKIARATRRARTRVALSTSSDRRRRRARCRQRCNHVAPRAIESGLQTSTRRVACVKSSRRVSEIESSGNGLAKEHLGARSRAEARKGTSTGKSLFSSRRAVALVSVAMPSPIHEHPW